MLPPAIPALPFETVVRRRESLVFSAYRVRSAADTDYDLLLRRATIVLDVDSGKPVIAYFPLDAEPAYAPTLAAIESALHRIKYQTNFRTSGLPTTSRIFGYHPRVTIRNDYCGATSLALEMPSEHAAIAAGVELIGPIYQAVAPDVYERHCTISAEKVLPDYSLAGSAFTSGIVNQNNPLKYHFDSGNFDGVWSAMLGFKRSIANGYLVLPAYRLALEIADRSLTMFDGQGILHGVSPFRLLRPDARRHTIVYYSLKGMWQCRPLGEEIARIRKLRTERERKRR